MNRAFLLALAASVATPAVAQDVIVMRKPYDIKLPELVPTAPEKGEWQIGDWRWEVPGRTCSDGADQVRDVACRTSTGVVPASRCAEPAPVTRQTLVRYEGCTTDWVTGSWSPWSDSCSLTAGRTRSVECRRSGGDSAPKIVDASMCGGTRPTGSETQAVLSSCTAEWKTGAWRFDASAQTCSDGALQVRDVTCETKFGVAPDASCTGTKPNTQQLSPRYEGCSVGWTSGSWSPWSSTCSASATHTRTVECQRSGGDSAPYKMLDSSCPNATRPIGSESQEVVSSCSYDWKIASYGPWTGACGQPRTRTVNYACNRSDNVTVSDSFCKTAKPPVTEDGAPLACVNMISDGDLEWSYNTWSPAGRNQDNPHGGKYYGVIGGGRYTSKLVDTLVKGKTYVLSVWTKSTLNTCGASVVQLSHGYPLNLPIVCKTTWTQTSYTFTATMTQASIALGGGDRLDFDDLTLYEK